jgi:hypothetical protein
MLKEASTVTAVTLIVTLKRRKSANGLAPVSTLRNHGLGRSQDARYSDESLIEVLLRARRPGGKSA